MLIAEATTTPTVGSGCTLTGGRWYSYYDNVYWTNPSDLDIDHVVRAGRGVGLRCPHVDHLAGGSPSPTTWATPARWSR